MCQSYKKTCACGEKTAEIFFGRMVLDPQAVSEVYCPKCSTRIDPRSANRVWDNGWVLELNMQILQSHAPAMGVDPDDVTADFAFDAGFATWVGSTPDDYQTRDEERAEIQKLAKTDLPAYIRAMKAWGLSREKRFREAGWRKSRGRSEAGTG